LYKAWSALDDLFAVYLTNKDLWRDRLDEAIDASQGCRILACNFHTPNLQLWWKYIYADIIEHYDTYDPEAVRPIVCLMDCTEHTEPMHVLQLLLTAIGVGEAHSRCGIEQCLAELEASLVNCSSSSSSKIILVLHQNHRLTELGDAGTMVLEGLLQLTRPDKSRFILVGLTSQAVLPLITQQITQKDCVKPVTLTDEEAVQLKAVVQDAIGSILVPSASSIIRQWIVDAGGWMPVAVEFCCDVLEIAWYQKAGAVVNEQHLIAAYSDWRLDLEAVRPNLSCFKHSQLS
jgi:hypothetical protein